MSWKRLRLTSSRGNRHRVSRNPGRMPHSSMRSRICKERVKCASFEQAETQFHDRSAICTAALAVYLRHPVSDALSRELERIKSEAIFQKRVFFIRNLGFITHTEARRISFEETLRFERIHEETYQNFGFEIVLIEPGSLLDRVAAIKGALAS